MNKEEFDARVAAFLETQENAHADEWYGSDFILAREFVGRFSKHLFPTPVPVTVDRVALETAIDALTEATNKLSPADGNRVSNEQAISVLTKALNGGTIV